MRLNEKEIRKYMNIMSGLTNYKEIIFIIKAEKDKNEVKEDMEWLIAEGYIVRKDMKSETGIESILWITEKGKKASGFPY
ncbi:MAG TPA: hypothetical protein DIC60_09300 [Lachnospiraceae bacterium]|nr:hypothetical protein [Lachnospiraceae bacterium]